MKRWKSKILRFEEEKRCSAVSLQTCTKHSVLWVAVAKRVGESSGPAVRQGEISIEKQFCLTKTIQRLCVGRNEPSLGREKEGNVRE